MRWQKLKHTAPTRPYWPKHKRSHQAGEKLAEKQSDIREVQADLREARRVVKDKIAKYQRKLSEKKADLQEIQQKLNRARADRLRCKITFLCNKRKRNASVFMASFSVPDEILVTELLLLSFACCYSASAAQPLWVIVNNNYKGQISLETDNDWPCLQQDLLEEWGVKLKALPVNGWTAHGCLPGPASNCCISNRYQPSAALLTLLIPKALINPRQSGVSTSRWDEGINAFLPTIAPAMPTTKAIAPMRIPAIALTSNWITALTTAHGACAIRIPSGATWKANMAFTAVKPASIAASIAGDRSFWQATAIQRIPYSTPFRSAASRW